MCCKSSSLNQQPFVILQEGRKPESRCQQDLPSLKALEGYLVLPETLDVPSRGGGWWGEAGGGGGRLGGCQHHPNSWQDPGVPPGLGLDGWAVASPSPPRPQNFWEMSQPLHQSPGRPPSPGVSVKGCSPPVPSPPSQAPGRKKVNVCMVLEEKKRKKKGGEGGRINSFYLGHNFPN